jgi:hypothetical protein
VEGDLAGPWNFRLEDDSAGVVLFGGHSLVRFSRDRDRLHYGGRVYQKCHRSQEVKDSGGHAREQLPFVHTPALLAQICRRDWVKEDDFNLFMDPQTLHFDSALNCRMGFRDGTCEQVGRFSLLNGALYLEMNAPGCDQRGGINLFANAIKGAAVIGDTLTFNTSLYAPVGSPGTLRRARGLGNHGDLVLDVEYDGPLESGIAKQLSIRFANQRRYGPGWPMHLAGLKVTTQLLKVGGDGLAIVGKPHRIATRSYHDVEIPVGSSLSDTLTIVVPERGEFVQLEIVWDCRDRAQEYHPRAWTAIRVR